MTGTNFTADDLRPVLNVDWDVFIADQGSGPFTMAVYTTTHNGHELKYAVLHFPNVRINSQRYRCDIMHSIGRAIGDVDLLASRSGDTASGALGLALQDARAKLGALISEHEMWINHYRTAIEGLNDAH